MLHASHSVKPGSVLFKQILSVVWLLLVWLGAQAALNELSGTVMETGVESQVQVELDRSLSYFQEPCESCEGLVADQRVPSDAFLSRSL